MNKVLVFGSGAVGCIYAYLLHKGGANIVAVCRSNYDAIRKAGVTIRSALYGTVSFRPDAVVRTVEEAARDHAPFDYIFVSSKAFAGTATKISDAVLRSPGCAIILAQNGIGIEDEYAETYPSRAIISGVVWLPTTQVAPGMIEMGPLERLELGTFPSNASAEHKSKADKLAEMLKKGGGTPVVHDDVQPCRWSKVAVNCTFNPMAALTRIDGANLLLSSDMADDMIVKIIRQVGQVASSVGYPHLSDEALIHETMRYHRSRKEIGGKDPSMLVDVKQGRPIEVEAILGNLVRIARKQAVDVPYLELLYMLATAVNFGIEKPDGRWKTPLAA